MTDKGGELNNSLEFWQLIFSFNYLLQPTATNAPHEKSLAKCPNQTFGNMILHLLHSINLPSEFWSFARIHAVHIKNILPHESNIATPYYTYTGTHPTAGNLHIFGCRMHVRLPGERPLTNHATVGTFLGCTMTNKNIIYYDTNSKGIETATHIVYNEANITVSQPDRSQASKNGILYRKCTTTTNATHINRSNTNMSLHYICKT